RAEKQTRPDLINLRGDDGGLTWIVHPSTVRFAEVRAATQAAHDQWRVPAGKMFEVFGYCRNHWIDRVLQRIGDCQGSSICLVNHDAAIDHEPNPPRGALRL